MSDPVLLVDRSDEAIAVLTLNRPERRNALTIELMESLCNTLNSLAAEPRRRVAIVRGNGAAFCAGLDLHEAAVMGVAERAAPWVARTFQTIITSPLVTIAAAHGAAYAGGAGLMSCCDVIVAADGLMICCPEVRRGLLPALIAAVLHLRLRHGDLRQLVLLGEPIDAPTASRMGLVQRVVPADRLLPEAQSVAATVLKGAPHAVRWIKRLLRDFQPNQLDELFALALDAHRKAFLTDEAAEGIAAFRQHREPTWWPRIE